MWPGRPSTSSSGWAATKSLGSRLATEALSPDSPAMAVPPDLEDHIEPGRKLFAGEAGFIWAASRIDNLPPMKGVEIAFAGRSNVGKSSLVNALTGRKTLARTSHTPDRKSTRLNSSHANISYAVFCLKKKK